MFSTPSPTLFGVGLWILRSGPLPDRSPIGGPSSCTDVAGLVSRHTCERLFTGAIVLSRDDHTVVFGRQVGDESRVGAQQARPSSEDHRSSRRGSRRRSAVVWAGPIAAASFACVGAPAEVDLRGVVRARLWISVF